MYQRILVPIDGSPTSLRGLREAVAIARLTKGRIRLLHVIDEMAVAGIGGAFEGFRPDWLEALRTDGEKLLQDAKLQAEAEGVQAETLLHDGISPRLADVVVDEAEQWQADLIVLGTHGRRGIGRFLMGSGAENILRLAKVPVLLVRAAEFAAPAEPGKTATVSLPSAALAFE